MKGPQTNRIFQIQTHDIGVEDLLRAFEMPRTVFQGTGSEAGASAVPVAGQLMIIDPVEEILVNSVCETEELTESVLFAEGELQEMYGQMFHHMVEEKEYVLRKSLSGLPGQQLNLLVHGSGRIFLQIENKGEEPSYELFSDVAEATSWILSNCSTERRFKRLMTALDAFERKVQDWFCHTVFLGFQPTRVVDVALEKKCDCLADGKFCMGHNQPFSGASTQQADLSQVLQFLERYPLGN